MAISHMQRDSIDSFFCYAEQDCLSWFVDDVIAGALGGGRPRVREVKRAGGRRP